MVILNNEKWPGLTMLSSKQLLLCSNAYDNSKDFEISGFQKNITI